MNKQFLGNYRGIVVDNNGDKGRCRIYIPGVHPEEFEKDPTALQWAEPAMSLFGGNYSGTGTNSQTGVCTTPHIGTNVWVFFEQGNYNFPVYFAACQGGEGWFADSNNQHSIKTDNVSVVVSEKYKDKDVEISPSTRVEIIATGNIYLKIIGNVNIEVDGNVTEKITGNVNRKVDGNVTEKITGNFDVTVNGSATYKVDGSYDKTVWMGETDTIGINHSETVLGIDTLTVLGSKSITVGGIYTEDVYGSSTETVMLNKNTSVEGANTKTVLGADVETVAGVKNVAVVGSYLMSSPIIAMTGASITANGEDLTFDMV